MPRLALLWVALASLLALMFSGVAHADQIQPLKGTEAALAPGQGAEGEHGPAAGEHGSAAGEHGEHAGEHEPGEINWFYGMISEKEGAEPSLLFRPKGMQPPLAAMLLNFGILAYVVVRFARRPLTEALKKRKTSIMQGIEDASRMKDEARARLEDFEEKLKHIDDEVERVRREMREAGEAERVRSLSEAKDRRERMERDAKLLIEQELKAAREELTHEVIAGAVKSAAAQLAKEISSADHQRLADEYLADIDRWQVNARGGQA